MPIPQKTDWPKTAEGTTDWETLFEDDEAGLVAYVQAASSPQQLKERVEEIIRAIFIRRPDATIITRVMTFMNKLIPEDASPQHLPTMQAAIHKMLMKVKDDRIKKAAAFVAKKARQKNKRQSSKKKPDRRANPIVVYLQNNNGLKAVLIVLLGALVPLGIFLGSPDVETGRGNIKEHINWINNNVFNNLPQQNWELLSVKQSKPTQIDIEILISNPDHINAIHAMKRIARVALLNQVCPAAGSGVEKILDQGWHLWVTLNGPGEILTGGTCHYK